MPGIILFGLIQSDSGRLLSTGPRFFALDCARSLDQCAAMPRPSRAHRAPSGSRGGAVAVGPRWTRIRCHTVRRR